MTGRSSGMTQTRGGAGAVRLTRSPRTLCLVAALLCALGVLTGAVVHTAHGAHHRGPSAVALTGVPDGHGTGHSGSQHAIAEVVAVRTSTTISTAAAVDRPASTSVGVDAARTRGPPQSL